MSTRYTPKHLVSNKSVCAHIKSQNLQLSEKQLFHILSSYCSWNVTVKGLQQILYLHYIIRDNTSLLTCCCSCLNYFNNWVKLSLYKNARIYTRSTAFHVVYKTIEKGLNIYYNVSCNHQSTSCLHQFKKGQKLNSVHPSTEISWFSANSTSTFWWFIKLEDTSED